MSVLAWILVGGALMSALALVGTVTVMLPCSQRRVDYRRGRDEVFAEAVLATGPAREDRRHTPHCRFILT